MQSKQNTVEYARLAQMEVSLNRTYLSPIAFNWSIYTFRLHFFSIQAKTK